MSVHRFDIAMLERYHNPPPLLHFEFGRPGKDGRLFRYVLVQSFALKELDPDTRRTTKERAEHIGHEAIRARILESIRNGAWPLNST